VFEPLFAPGNVNQDLLHGRVRPGLFNLNSQIFEE